MSNPGCGKQGSKWNPFRDLVGIAWWAKGHPWLRAGDCLFDEELNTSAVSCTWKIHSLKLAASSPLKIGLLPQKGTTILFQASIFRCKLAVSFREGIYEDSTRPLGFHCWGTIQVYTLLVNWDIYVVLCRICLRSFRFILYINAGIQ